MALGKNIYLLRSSRNITLEAVARAVETDASTIKALERRDSKKSKYAPKLAAFFGILMDDLLREDFDPYSAGHVRSTTYVAQEPAALNDSAAASTRDERRELELIYASREEIAMITAYREATKEGVDLINSAVQTARKFSLGRRNLRTNGANHE